MLSRWRCATVLRVPSYLLRVQLEDRPGSLGSLAVALGSVGADILSLDVVERGAGYAIDDLSRNVTRAKLARAEGNCAVLPRMPCFTSTRIPF